MEQPKANSPFSVQNHVYDMTGSRSGSWSDKKLHPPFQAIIEKGRQAKAQVEQDQYEARKAKRESEIKNAARIRHAEAEANRRRAEESKLSIDEYKEKLLDEMTTNITAILEENYRKEVRAKVYENEDRIASAHEQDVKDKTEARLGKELESVVMAKLGAQFEPEVKQRLAVELVSVVKAELQAKHETEVRQQLVQDLGPAVEIELRARYETEVKQRLTEELQPEVKAELRAQYEEEIKNQLMNESESTIIHDQRGTQTDDDNKPWGQRDILHTLEEESFRPTPNDINTKGDEYPDLSHHHLINQDSVQNDQQEAGFIQTSETTIVTDGDALVLPRGTKRSLSGVDDEEGDSHARRSKRSRSSSDSEEQQLPSRNVEAVSNPYSGRLRTHESHQGVRHNGDDSQGLSHYKGDNGHEGAQGNNRDSLDHGSSGYNSSDEVQGSPENSTGYGNVDYRSAGDVHEMKGKFLVREWTTPDSAEYVQQANGDLSQDEEADFDSDDNFQEMNGTFLDPKGAVYNSTEDMQGTNGEIPSHEEANYDSARDVRVSNRYNMAKATESYDSEDEDREDDEDDEDDDEEENEDEDEDEEDEGVYGEEYGSEEEEEYSTAPQAGIYSKGGNGVISFSNTQDTAFVLSDSEDEAEKAGDDDKTLVGNDGAGALIDAKECGMPAEETLSLNA